MKTFLLITGLSLNILLCFFPFQKFTKEEPTAAPVIELNRTEPLDTGATSYAYLLKAQATNFVSEHKH